MFHRVIVEEILIQSDPVLVGELNVQLLDLALCLQELQKVLRVGKEYTVDQ